MATRSTSDCLRHAELLNAALTYAGFGWRVIPVHTPTIDSGGAGRSCGDLACTKSGKLPRIKRWPKRATTGDSQIRIWWDESPLANIGILTGHESNLVVLDVDPGHGGTESLHKLFDFYGPLPTTVQSVSGGGGSHYYFRHPGGNIKSTSDSFGPLYPGLDIRGDGGYIIAPPSLHALGEKYRWVEGLEPHCTELASLPNWVPRVVTKARKKTSRRGPQNDGSPTGRSEVNRGTRNVYLTSFAGAVSPYCSTETELVDYVGTHNETHCCPPLLRSDVTTIASSVGRYENGLLQDLMFEVWSPNELDKLEKAILWTLIRYCNWSTWQCWPSRETIKNSAGVSLKSTDRTLKSLSSRGLISWERCAFQSNLYTVHLEKVRSITSEESSPNPPAPSCLDTGSQRPLEETDSCPPDT